MNRKGKVGGGEGHGERNSFAPKISTCPLCSQCFKVTANILTCSISYLILVLTAQIASIWVNLAANLWFFFFSKSFEPFLSTSVDPVQQGMFNLDLSWKNLLTASHCSSWFSGCLAAARASHFSAILCAFDGVTDWIPCALGAKHTQCKHAGVLHTHAAEASVLWLTVHNGPFKTLNSQFSNLREN